MNVPDDPIRGCTVCSSENLSAALVLAESFLAYHPDGTFTALVTDGTQLRAPPACPAAHDRVGLVVWNVDSLHLGSMQRSDLMNGSEELVQLVLRPWLVSTLLDLDRSPVLLIDPRSLVVRSLRTFAQRAYGTGAAFVGRLLEPILPSGPTDIARVREVLEVGTLDPGLIAVADTEGGRRLLRWWKAAARAGATTPRLLDIAPAFGHPVVRDAGLLLSRWNVDERPVSTSDGGLLAGGVPLRIAAFDGLHSAELSPGPLGELVREYENLVATMERLR